MYHGWLTGSALSFCGTLIRNFWLLYLLLIFAYYIFSIGLVGPLIIYPIVFIINLVMAYTLVCLIISIFKKFKK